MLGILTYVIVFMCMQNFSAQRYVVHLSVGPQVKLKPRWARLGPSWGQVGAKMLQVGAKIAQVGRGRGKVEPRWNPSWNEVGAKIIKLATR